MFTLPSNPVSRLLRWWIGGADRFAPLVIVVAVVGAAISIHYARNNLGVNTDTADMISPHLPWRRAYDAYKRDFPHTVDTLQVVIDGETPELAARASRILAGAIAREHALVHWVYDPGGDEFFLRHGLLYSTIDDLEALADALADAQPLLATLMREPNLAGLAGLFTMLARREVDPGAGLGPLLRALDEAADAVVAGRYHEVSWRRLMLGEAGATHTRQIVVVKPRLDYSALFPAEEILARIRALVREENLTGARGIRVRITGGSAMAHEELHSVSSGAERAALLALALVVGILLLGLRSLRLVVACVVTLVVGLAWTAAFAAAAVGSLNLISVAFAVLYIGLGIDYAIHFSLRYQERLNECALHSQALDQAAAEVGTSLILCTLTTGFAFYAFVPTDFDGISELGIISGTGMFISLFATLTVLPAMLGVLRLRPSTQTRPALAPRWLMSWPQRNRPVVLAVAGLGGFLALTAASGIRFDDNPLNLRDPGGEAVSTYRDLLAERTYSPWPMVAMVPDRESIPTLGASLVRLSEVEEVSSILDLLPDDQDSKLDLLEILELTLALDLPPPPPDELSPPVDRRHEVESIIAALDSVAASAAQTMSSEQESGIDRTRIRLASLLAIADPKVLERFETSVFAALPDEVERLRAGLGAESITLESLPERLRRRWQAPGGELRVEITSAHDISDASARDRFVGSVRHVLPHATGTPLVYVESGRVVVNAFTQAFISAFLIIGILLVVMMRSGRDALRVLLPMLLGAALTVGFMVGAGVSFNFANVIALPLLLGIGVDNGVHMVHRSSRALPSGASLLATSTTRGVIVSSLTTIGGFGSLAFSNHPGTASMGVVLTLGMVLGVVCTVVVIPALVASGRDVSPPPGS